MIAKDGTGIDGGEKETSLKGTPYSLAEAGKIIGSRVEGVVLIDQKKVDDDCEEDCQDIYAVIYPKAVKGIGKSSQGIGRLLGLWRNCDAASATILLIHYVFTGRQTISSLSSTVNIA